MARHLSSMVICMVTLCHKTNVKQAGSFVVPCRKRASEALPKSDGQQEDRFACPLPSHCRRRLINPKHPLFLTYYSEITAITGSVPPSPREKALVREESNIKKQSLAGFVPTHFYSFCASFPWRCRGAPVCAPG